MTFFLVVEDLARASIGPFATEAEAQAHYTWTKEVRGDGAGIIGIAFGAHDPDADLRMTPEEDKADTGEDFVS